MKKIFTFFLVLATFVTSQAQVKYHDVDPDTTVNTWDAFSVLGTEIWWHPTPEVVITTWGTTEVLCSLTNNLPMALDPGDPIDNNGNWKTTSYVCLNCSGSSGNWKGVTDKYLGIRNKNTAGQWVYGWSRLDINSAATYFTIKDYAQRTEGNNPILAGQENTLGVGNSAIHHNILVPVVSGKTVRLEGLENSTNLSIADMNGRIILQTRIQPGGMVDMNAYPAGMYLFRITGTTLKVVTK
jgi:hypothetical protein